MSVEDELRKAIESICTDPENYVPEACLERRLKERLGCAEDQEVMTFDPPPIAPKLPPAEDIAELAEQGYVLPTTGIDSCDGVQRKLDALWNNIPIELKGVAKVGADRHGYDFLKDIHRLERLSSVGSGTVLSDTRFAVFVSADAKLWQHEYLRAPNICDGQTMESGHWVQYKQPSARTRWYDYPPFYLAGRYELNWSPLPNGAKYLLVSVKKQNAPNI